MRKEQQKYLTKKNKNLQSLTLGLVFLQSLTLGLVFLKR